MSKFWDKVVKRFPGTADSLDDTKYALRSPTIFSDFIQGGAGLGALVGGIAGLGLGIAAMTGMIWAAPVASLALMYFAGAAVVPVACAAALGTVGAGIGFATSYVLRAGLGGVGAAFSLVGDVGEMLRDGLSRRTKDNFFGGYKWGAIGGAVLGLAVGVAGFVAAPAIGTALGILSATFLNAMALGGAAAFLSLPLSGIERLVDKLRGKDPSLSGNQEQDVKEDVRLRNDRIGREDTLEYYAKQGWTPHLKEALPQDVYEKLSDEGKMSALSAVFKERSESLGNYDRRDKDPELQKKLPEIFNGFAQNARKILEAEQARAKELPEKERKKEDLISRARDKVLQKPENRVVYGSFGEVVKQY